MQIEVSSAAIVVIGAGTMGAGIAFVAAQSGHRVTIVDSSHSGLQRGRSLVAEMTKAARSRGLIDDAGCSALAERIVYTTQLGQVSAADIIIEAVVEDLDVKAQLIETACSQMAPNAIFATNTSSLSVAKLAGYCPLAERFVGLHFFNPVPAMKLVEVIPGPDTASDVIDDLAALMKSWRKVPVVARDVPGFIVNNVARPYYGEAFVALEEGLSPCSIDALLCGAGGFRMGPLALADMIGHDVNYAAASSVYEGRNGIVRFRPSPVQASLVERGLLGHKVGRGVYDAFQAPPAVSRLEESASLCLVKIAADHSRLVGLADRLRAAGNVVEIHPALPADTLVYDNARIAMGDGRPLAAMPDIDVLFDAVRDWSQARTIGVTARSDLTQAAASRLASSLGLQALVIPDRPGQVVLRTLAQVANAAADALIEKVASPSDIETALKLGANHPEGPLAWAARMGTGRLRETLENLAQATGDPIYLPSKGLAEIEEAA